LQNLQSGTVDVYCFQAAIEAVISPGAARILPEISECIVQYYMSSTDDETMVALTNGTVEIGLVLNPPIRDAIQSTEFFRDTIGRPA